MASSIGKIDENEVECDIYIAELEDERNSGPVVSHDDRLLSFFHFSQLKISLVLKRILRLTDQY